MVEVPILIITLNFSSGFVTFISILTPQVIFLNYTINILMNAKIKQLQPPKEVPLI